MSGVDNKNDILTESINAAIYTITIFAKNSFQRFLISSIPIIEKVAIKRYFIMLVLSSFFVELGKKVLNPSYNTQIYFQHDDSETFFPPPFPPPPRGDSKLGVKFPRR